MKQICKRDGTLQDFRREKITKAILKAFKQVDGTTTNGRDIAENIADSIQAIDKNSMSVEEIQDIVENELMESGRKDVAKAYIIYRNDRTRTRMRNSDFNRRIMEKLSAHSDDRQNANVDGKSFGGRQGAVTDEVMKEIALNEYMSETARKNHEENEIYTHDLNAYAVGMHNCLSAPIDKLLKNGFDTRQTDVRPAQSIGTACQLIAVIFQLQSLMQFGGVSATHIDWTLAPYVRKTFRKKYMANWIKDNMESDSNILSMFFDTYTDEVGVIRSRFEDYLEENKSFFEEKTHLSEQDFFFGNKKLDKKYYQEAMFDTIQETKQSVEALYHNLNTLQSRSGNQLD